VRAVFQYRQDSPLAGVTSTSGKPAAQLKGRVQSRQTRWSSRADLGSPPASQQGRTSKRWPPVSSAASAWRSFRQLARQGIGRGLQRWSPSAAPWSTKLNAVNTAQRALLWVQLLWGGGPGLLLLASCLLLLLLLAGSDPGPLPGLERLLLLGPRRSFCPAALLWQQPA